MNTWTYKTWISEVKHELRNNPKTIDIPAEDINQVLETFHNIINDEYNEGYSPKKTAGDNAETIHIRWNGLKSEKEKEIKLEQVRAAVECGCL